MKAQRVSQRDKICYGKRKAVEVKEAAVSQLATILRVRPDDLEEATEATDCVACSDLRQRVCSLKDKHAITDSKERKLMILTLAPQSWTIEKLQQSLVYQFTWQRRQGQLEESMAY
jgi:hypothetical protein